jgi:hypothetical protein
MVGTLRKKLFLSHYEKETDIAQAFQRAIEKAFLGMVEVFVSSDSRSIPVGRAWLDTVERTLRECAVFVVIASPESIERRWINFELGAVWMREIPIIPLLHSGLTTANLPRPFSDMSAVVATDWKGLQRITAEIAKALGSEVPAIDFNPFIADVQDYEFWKPAREAFQALKKLNPQIVTGLYDQRVVQLTLFDDEIERLARLLEPLEKRGVLAFRARLGSAFGPNGPCYTCHLEPIGKISVILDDARCRI